MLLLRNIKSLFEQHTLLATLFVVVLVVCSAGALWGVNAVFCVVRENNSAIERACTVQLLPLDGRVPDFTALKQRYQGQLACIFAELTMEDEQGDPVSVTAYDYTHSALGDGGIPAGLGSDISAQEMAMGARMAILESKRYSKAYLDETICLGGVSYMVVGLGEATMIPLRSLDSVQRISIYFIDPVSGSFAGEMQTFFQGSYPSCRIVLPEAEETDSIFDHIPSLLLIAVFLLLGFTDLAFLYAYFLQMRRRQFSLFRLLGASRLKLVGICLSEMLFILTVCYAIGLAVYKALSPLVYRQGGVMTMYYVDCLGASACLVVYAVMAAMFAILFIPAVLRLARSADATHVWEV